MDELLSAAEAARRLGISRSSFWRLQDRLRAKGMRVVLIPSSREEGRPGVRYQASSIHRLITRAAERETAVC